MKHQSGMTLLELLIATAILAIMAGMGLLGIQSLIQAEQRISLQESEWRSRNMMAYRITQDVQMALSDQAGNDSPLQGQSNRFELYRFQSALLPQDDQAQWPIDDVVQVAWYWRAGQLYRSTRPWLQRHDEQQWQAQVVAEVKQFRCEYLGFDGQISPQWPQANQALQGLPKQIKCLVVDDKDRRSNWVLTPWSGT